MGVPNRGRGTSRRDARRRGTRCPPWTRADASVTTRRVVRCRAASRRNGGGRAGHLPSPGCSRCADGTSCPGRSPRGDEHDRRDVVTPGETGVPDAPMKRVIAWSLRLRVDRRRRSCAGRSVCAACGRGTARPEGTTTHARDRNVGSGPCSLVAPRRGCHRQCAQHECSQEQVPHATLRNQSADRPAPIRSRTAPPPAKRSEISRVCRLWPRREPRFS